jgi:hypothetical protein
MSLDRYDENGRIKKMVVVRVVWIEIASVQDACE